MNMTSSPADVDLVQELVDLVVRYDSAGPAPGCSHVRNRLQTVLDERIAAAQPDADLERVRIQTLLAAVRGARRMATDVLDTIENEAARRLRVEGMTVRRLAAEIGISERAAIARYRSDGHEPPPAQLVTRSVLTVPNSSGSPGNQRYPVEAWSLAAGELVVIVTDVYGNTSLMNASERIGVAVENRWPGARIVECWPGDASFGAPGRGGRYVWSSRDGGNWPVDLDELAALGLDLRR
jgi:hypothetical protein